MEKEKNIWIINHDALPPSLGGLNRHYYFTRELIKRGYNVKIFTASSIHNTDINMIKQEEKVKFKDVEVEGVTYTYIKEKSYQGSMVARIKNIISFLFDIQTLKKHYKNEYPDLIYTSSPDLITAFSAVILAKRIKVPVVVEIRDLWPLSIVEYKGMSNKNPIIQILYQIEKWIYEKANALIFTMPGGKQYIIDKKWDKKISLDKVFNINNGIDLDEINSLKEGALLSDADLNENNFKVVYAGSIRTANCVDKVVEAAKVIQNKKIKDITFLIYGDGDKKQELEHKCKDEGIINVKFKGKVSKKELHPILCKCDVALLTYKNANTWKYGGSQNKVFEYMACGLPIVTNINMEYSILNNKKCGLNTEDNPEAIANAILKIKNLNKDNYNEMSNRAIIGSQDFDYKILTNKLESVFDYTISNKEEKRKCNLLI